MYVMSCDVIVMFQTTDQDCEPTFRLNQQISAYHQCPNQKSSMVAVFCSVDVFQYLTNQLLISQRDNDNDSHFRAFSHG